MSMTNQESINMLRRLGQRRQRHLEAGERLADDIRQALADTEGAVSRVEAAELLGIDRSTLYDIYLPSKEAS